MLHRQSDIEELDGPPPCRRDAVSMTVKWSPSTSTSSAWPRLRRPPRRTPRTGCSGTTSSSRPCTHQTGTSSGTCRPSGRPRVRRVPAGHRGRPRTAPLPRPSCGPAEVEHPGLRDHRGDRHPLRAPAVERPRTRPRSRGAHRPSDRARRPCERSSPSTSASRSMPAATSSKVAGHPRPPDRCRPGGTRGSRPSSRALPGPRRAARRARRRTARSRSRRGRPRPRRGRCPGPVQVALLAGRRRSAIRSGDTAVRLTRGRGSGRRPGRRTPARRPGPARRRRGTAR